MLRWRTPLGAGDVYNAGFIAKRLEGGTLSQCLEYGNAVSGYTVERKGARSCPYRNDVETIFGKTQGGIMSDKRKVILDCDPGHDDAFAIMLAAAAICAYLPQGLLSPFGGVIADKHNRKTVMIVADLSVGIVSLGLGIVILFGQVSFPLLMILVIVRSIGQAFHGPAMMAAMPLLVPEKHLLRINTLDQLLMSVASIGAPAFGIFLYTTIGFHSVMFLDFAGALVAVAGLALAKIPTVADETAENQHVLANLRDGWKALSATRGLVVLIAGITIGMMAFAPLGAISRL